MVILHQWNTDLKIGGSWEYTTKLVLKITVYDFSTDYCLTNIEDVVNIHGYLMKYKMVFEMIIFKW